jgi:hypothetical protein
MSNDLAPFDEGPLTKLTPDLRRPVALDMHTANKVAALNIFNSSIHVDYGSYDTVFVFPQEQQKSH